jgi:2-oxoglutarate ferredoxin oxidoreductase subunit alpha
MSDEGMERFKPRTGGSTLWLDRAHFGQPVAEAGGPLYFGMVLFGYFCRMFRIPDETCDSLVFEQWKSKGDQVVLKNAGAVRKGMAFYDAGGKTPVGIPEKGRVRSLHDKLLGGSEAVGIGSVAGGCDFVAAYPMSPSTGVLQWMASKAAENGIIVEQAEDEIAAVNMALGAWYAGGRGLTTTSGGGFALMTEGLSLAGMTETPLVVHLAQRPGPATGLPTRTEQGDLNLALYAGHGDFPRLILAPGNKREAVELARHAFLMADEFQVPVILLTDQYLLDSFSVEEVQVPVDLLQNRIVETAGDYMRYRITENGISPRGIPGYGQGLVRVDSDEHDEWGRICEDTANREAMVAKRSRKFTALKEMTLGPESLGDPAADCLLLCWGSVRDTLKEAVSILNSLGGSRFNLLCFTQLYPLPETIGQLLEGKRLVAVENNAAGHFADLVQKETGILIRERILKFDGFPFSVEELVHRIGPLAGGPL